MAFLFKQQTTVHVDPNTGRRVPSGTPGAEKTVIESRKWYAGGVPGLGRRPPLSADRRRAERMLAELVRRAELGSAGVPVGAAGGTALGPLVAEFEQAVGRRAAPKQVKTVGGHVRKVLAGCRLETLADLRAAGLIGRVEQFVKSLADGDDGFTRATSAYVGKHARQFTRWLWRKRELLDRDPLAGMDLPSQETTSPRRALSAEELAALITNAERSPTPFRSLAGRDRAVLYLCAVATGYRSGELARLTPSHFDLDGDVPIVRLRKGTKNKKPAEQPIPPAVAARLRTYLAGRPADRPVWPGTWHPRAADMLRADLAAAGVPLVVDDEEAVFHSLRHSYTTLLSQVAPVKVTQELARHSTPVLTLGLYSHAGMPEKVEAVNRLPLPGADVAARPFGSMGRAELERTAELLLVLVLAGPLFTPALTPNRETAGDGRRPAGTKKGRRPAA
jgi:integrase